MNIKDIINTELGVYNEYNELKRVRRDLDNVKRAASARFFELYQSYDKEHSYREAEEALEHFLEQRWGKELYNDIKWCDEYINERMALLNKLL